MRNTLLSFDFQRSGLSTLSAAVFLLLAAGALSSCSMMQSSSSTTTQQPQTVSYTQQTNSSGAMSAGQGAGSALINLYNQYKADGNKFNYSNMQNILNTLSLISNCEGLKSNYKNTHYLKNFGKGVIASSLGLVTQNNVQTVTNSLVDMVKGSESVQQVATQSQSTLNSAIEYANTASQYAGAIGNLLSLFGQ